MAAETAIKKQNKVFQTLLEELKAIRDQLEKLLVLIPEESLKDYKNSSQIKKSYLKAIKIYPSK